MATWDDVQAWLRARFRIVRDEPTWCGWSVEIGGAPQPLLVKVTEGQGPLQLILAGRVCDRRAIDPVEALRYNSVADAGSLVLEGETYLLRVLLPLAVATLAQLAQSLDALAVESARLRTLQQSPESRPAASRVCFAHLSD